MLFANISKTILWNNFSVAPACKERPNC